MPRSTRSQPTRSSEIVDLTFSDSDEEEPPVEDHMHTVVDILRPGAVDLTETETSPLRKRRKMRAADPSHKRRTETKNGKSSDEPRPRRFRQEDAETMGFRNASPPRWRAPMQLEPSPTLRTQAKKATNEPFKPFPLMDFPPEIRNSVYRFLLTTPSPIELPELTGRNGASHRLHWSRCTTASMRRKHKTIFLEILQTCKQIHDEASGILYGCNVFKYRSNPGARSSRAFLPTRHLQLLKHIKISVMSRGDRWRSQDTEVAELVKQFARDDLSLETFEITWWGQDRYWLRKDSPMCDALGRLVVERHFIMKVAGAARMEKGMCEQLEDILSEKGKRIVVKIHRPVKENGEELEDDGGRDGGW